MVAHMGSRKGPLSFAKVHIAPSASMQCSAHCYVNADRLIPSEWQDGKLTASVLSKIAKGTIGDMGNFSVGR